MKSIPTAKIAPFVFLLLSGLLSSCAQDPLLVGSFPLKPTNTYPTLKVYDAGSLYFLERPTGDNIADPFLLKQGSDFGIVDYLTNRVFWLDEQLKVREVAALGPLGVPQGDGYFAKKGRNAVYLYKDSYVADRVFLVPLPNENASVGGGVWFQAETLFFWDSSGYLHFVENPVDAGEGERANPLSEIKGSAFAKTLLTKNAGKFAGLVWNDRYGLMRNGLPLAQIYNRDWQNFFEDQRKAPKAAPKWGSKAIPPSWLNAMPLLEVGADGYQYWGWRGGVSVTRDGFVVASLTFPANFFDDLVVLPDGSILLSAWSHKRQVFEIFQVKKEW